MQTVCCMNGFSPVVCAFAHVMRSRPWDIELGGLAEMLGLISINRNDSIVISWLSFLRLTKPWEGSGSIRQFWHIHTQIYWNFELSPDMAKLYGQFFNGVFGMSICDLRLRKMLGCMNMSSLDKYSHRAATNGCCLAAIQSLSRFPRLAFPRPHHARYRVATFCGSLWEKPGVFIAIDCLILIPRG